MGFAGPQIHVAVRRPVDTRTRRRDPRRGTTARPAAAPAPLLVFYHGGGWVIGDLDTHDALCRLTCRDAGIHVLSIDYRLAPEHPAPAAVDDAYAAFRWAYEHAAELGAIPGTGRGRRRQRRRQPGRRGVPAGARRPTGPGPGPVLQWLIYPRTDFTAQTRSLSLFAARFSADQAGHRLVRGAVPGRLGHRADGPAGVAAAGRVAVRAAARADRGRGFRPAARRRRELRGGAAGRRDAVDLRCMGSLTHGFASLFQLGGGSAAGDQRADFGLARPPEPGLSRRAARRYSRSAVADRRPKLHEGSANLWPTNRNVPRDIDLKSADGKSGRLVRIGGHRAHRDLRGRARLLHRDLASRQEDGSAVTGQGDTVRVTSSKLVTKPGTSNPKAVVTFYEDFLCPACGNFERTFGPTVSKLIDIGAIAADYSMVAILDNPRNTELFVAGGRRRLCVADESHRCVPPLPHRAVHHRASSPTSAAPVPRQREADRARPRSRRRRARSRTASTAASTSPRSTAEATAAGITPPRRSRSTARTTHPSTPDASGRQDQRDRRRRARHRHGRRPPRRRDSRGVGRTRRADAETTPTPSCAASTRRCRRPARGGC